MSKPSLKTSPRQLASPLSNEPVVVDKKAMLTEKIERLLGKTKEKLKLNQVDPATRFNNRFFKEIRNLHTFVDAQKQLKRLNVFNDQKLLRQVQFLRANRKYRNIDDEKRVDQFINDQLLSELNFVEEEYHGEDVMRLELIAKQEIKPSINPEEYYRSLQVLQESEAALSKQQSPSTRHQYMTEAYERKIQANLLSNQMANRPQQDLFFESVQRSITDPQPTNVKQRGRVASQEDRAQKVGMLDNIITILQNSYGIDVNNDYINLRGDVHQTFKKNSDNLLQNIRNTAKAQFENYEKNQNEEQVKTERQSRKRRSEIERMIFRKQIHAHKKYANITQVGKFLQSVKEIQAPINTQTPSTQPVLSKTLSSFPPQPDNLMTPKVTMSVTTQRFSTLQPLESSRTLIPVSPKQYLKSRQSIQPDPSLQPIQQVESTFPVVASQPISVEHSAVKSIQASPRVSFAKPPMRKSVSISVIPGDQSKSNHNAFHVKRTYNLMSKQFQEFMTDVEQTHTQFGQHREEEDQQITGLDNDIEMMAKKYEHNQKLRSLGFSTHDPNLNLRSQLKQNIKNAAKNIRTIKIIKYY